MNSMVSQDQLNNISSYISKRLRKSFGKGPQTCQTTLHRKYLVTYINGFLSPMEEVLLNEDQHKTVDHTRNMIISYIMEEIKGVIQVTIGMDIMETFHDWNFPNNSGIMIFELESEVIVEELNDSIPLSPLEKEVSRISEIIQKVPDYIHITPITPYIYLVERKGILILIEKALIAKGVQEELHYTKDQLEKEYFHRYGRFDEIFNRSVKDIFIGWNFKEDKSIMAFILDNRKK